jgi:ubiquinone/menaquinone biosynthesis C-methylase UbiE
MESKWTEQDLMQIANQLSCPEGEEGIKTAQRMAHANDQMTQETYKALQLSAGEHILEIGPGNGNHVRNLTSLAKNLKYCGVDISETMVVAAKELNADLLDTGAASFHLTPADQLNFSANTFDKIFTVNTIYFWQDAEAYAREILRVLKPGGIFSLGFASRDFMEGLPFTKYRFNLYDKVAVETLLTKAGFSVLDFIEFLDVTTSNAGMVVEREVLIARATKDEYAR